MLARRIIVCLDVLEFGTGRVRNPVIEMMLEAYQHYYDSYYLVLSMPYP